MFNFFKSLKVNKENDKHINFLISAYFEKYSKKELKDMFINYQFMGEKKLLEELQYTKDDISRQIIIDNEEDIASVSLQEMIGESLRSLLPENITLLTFKGKFRDEPVYVTAYYDAQKLIAITVNFLADLPAKKGPILGIHTFAKTSLLEKDFISPVFGKSQKIASTLFWEVDDFGAMLGIAPGPSLALFLFYLSGFDIISLKSIAQSKVD